MKRYSYVYNNQNKSRSRNLRKSQTEAEKVLWSQLRARRFQGLKFHRQYPADIYILDFYCKEHNLVIELDGSQHMEEKNRVYDEDRTKTLEKMGLKVIRFFDNDIFNNLDGVMETIYAVTSPQPSPKRRGS